MNIEQRINKLEKELEELKKDVRKDDDWPKIGSQYFHVCENGDINLNHHTGTPYDLYRKSAGNMHRTEEEAKIYKERQIVEQMLRDIADELNGDEVIDWDNDHQTKYCLCYIYDIGELGFSNSVVTKTKDIYCLKGFDYQETAIERIGEERLIEFFKNY